MPPSVDAGGREPHAPIRTVDCAQALPGVLPEGRTESEPGFEALFDTLSVDALPPVLPAPGSATTAALVRYLLDVPGPEGALTQAHAADAGILGRLVLKAYAVKAADGSGGVDLAFLRRGLHRFYACATMQPETLEAFALRFGDYRAWPESTVSPSKPKGGARRLRFGPELSVAETLGEDGRVRETEVLWRPARRDGAFIFWAYDSDGRATNVSTFATSTGSENAGPSPFTCMSCHINREAGRYNRQSP